MQTWIRNVEKIFFIKNIYILITFFFKKKKNDYIKKRYYYINLNSYKGEWKNDQKDGYGTYIYNEKGEKYIGYWKNGERHGVG